MKNKKVFIDPVTSEQINKLLPLIFLGTEHIYINPAIKRIDIDLGGENAISFRQEFGIFKVTNSGEK